ncbi:hypothetical protein [Chromobacterium violaceum]|uniref:Uncharacterized protein n=1 Tax=Chromobacterium violaceum TaxID=536 RepID=A0A202BDL1_CHRVL|nr:hypothetical protein [Chromobacterium violaceum]MCD0492334.1 hypothetical protein [Chromobacterium violaceum]OVE49445.1 hypothetical protein CBW21_06065 [Chromobacterium violaceum]
MYSVKFLKHWGKYNPGEVAGFEEKDQELLERLAIAKIIGPTDEDLAKYGHEVAEQVGEQELVESKETPSLAVTDDASAGADEAAANSDQPPTAPRTSKKS